MIALPSFRPAFMGDGYHPTANARINAIYTAGGSCPVGSATAKQLLSNFIRAEEIAGRWSSMKRLYLTGFGNAAANAVDIVGGTSASFPVSGGVTHAAGYIQSNGTTGYMDTGTAWKSLGLSESDATIGTLNYTGNSAANMTTIGAGATVATAIRVSSQNSGVTPQCSWAGAGIVRGSIGTTGIQIASRSGGVTRMIRRTASGITEDTSSASVTGTVNNVNLTALANNVDGTTRALFSNAQVGAVIIAAGYSSANLSGFSANLKTLWEGLFNLTLP